MNPLRVARQLAGPRTMATSYHGAGVNRFTSDWLPGLLSADQEVGPGLRLLRARSRDMRRNSPHASGFIRDLQDNVIGVEEQGVRLQARNRAGRQFDAPMNTYLELRWAAWGVPVLCSADGRDSWADLQKLYIATLATDGEVLYRFLPGFDNEFGFAIEFLDPDQLDETLNRAAAPGQNEIRYGVEVDRYNRPTAYYLWTGHPAEWRKRGAPARVPANQVRHDFLKLRAGQTRGVPWFAASLIYWRHLEGFTVAELQQARAAACQGGFLTTKGEDAQMWLPPNGDLGSKKPVEMAIEPNTYTQLPPGVGLEAPDPVHPNANAPGFRKDIIRTISRGLGSSYTSLSGDFENTNYSSGRMGLLPERDFYRGVARWATVRFHSPAYLAWLNAAVLAGALQLTDPTAVSVHKWEYRGWPWVDPLNDVQAKELMLALKLTSPQKLCAELGVDLEENLEECAEAERMAASLGLTIGASEIRPSPRNDAPAADPADQKRNQVDGFRRLQLLAEGA